METMIVVALVLVIAGIAYRAHKRAKTDAQNPGYPRNSDPREPRDQNR